MPIMDGLGWTFDTVAPLYARLRPGYPEALYRAILEAVPLTAASRAVEVGIGGGQATEPILRTGCAVTAVEPGENFSHLCRERFGSYPGFSVITDRFENVSLLQGAYDLVYSASAFHWVPEQEGYARVFSLLRKGGIFARFANHPHPDRGRPELAEAIQRAYDRYYYPFHKKERRPLTDYGMEQARERADIAGKYGLEPVSCTLYQRTRDFTAAEYVTLLGTYSDHIAMDEPIRERFYDEIREAITAHGGIITVYDTVDLALARKP